MALQVVLGAMLKCSYGAAPSSLVVLPGVTPLMVTTPAATIMDFAPLMNVMPFGTCSSMANPEVAAATAAAMGALTPMPCVPMTVAPWDPGSASFKIAGMPALSSSCKLTCLWGGSIQISDPGQALMKIP